MNASRTRTGRIFERLAAIWQDTRYASQRLTAINRPWIAQRASRRETAESSGYTVDQLIAFS